MRKDKLTEVERQFASNLVIECPELWPKMREYMRESAYHEAGHLAATAFTKQEISFMQQASIIPDRNSMGRVNSEGPLIENTLASYPPAMIQREGRMLLLGLLAGRGVNIQMAEPTHRKDILDPKCGEWNNETSDLHRAVRVAEIMARPGMPARRILALAEKWAVEMLALPDVWKAVETLAVMLYDRGTIEADAILTACETMTPARDLPKWRRRLCMTQTTETLNN